MLSNGLRRPLTSLLESSLCFNLAQFLFYCSPLQGFNPCNANEVVNGTNINLADTDGCTDFEEINAGSNPLDPGSIPDVGSVQIPFPAWTELLLARLLGLIAPLNSANIRRC